MSRLEDDLQRVLHQRADGDYLTGADTMLDQVHIGAKRLHRRRVGAAVLSTLALVTAGAGIALGGGNLTNTTPPVVDQTITPVPSVTTTTGPALPSVPPGQIVSPGVQKPPVGGRTTSTPPPSTIGTPPPSTGTTQTTQPQSGPVVSGFTPTGIRPRGTGTFWVVGTADCDGTQCSPVLVTRDGGATYDLAGIPPGHHHTVGGSDDYLWVYGSSGFYASTDGGRTWKRPGPDPGWVTKTFSTSGAPVVIVNDGGKPKMMQSGGTAFHPVEQGLERPDDRSHWGRAVSSGRVGDEIAVTVSNTNHAPRPTGCTATADASQVSVVNDVIWLLCPAGSYFSVLRSTDAGLTWTTVVKNVRGTSGMGLAARSASTVVVGMSSGWGLRVITAGGSVREVRIPGVLDAGSVHFQTADVGYLVDGDSGYRTTDGGLTWSQLPFTGFR